MIIGSFRVPLEVGFDFLPQNVGKVVLLSGGGDSSTLHAVIKLV